MSKDMMIFNLCDHIIDGEKYTKEDCPLCLGKDYYYDIAFNEKGLVEMCEDEIKLQQEVLKILTDIKGGNRFFVNYGNPLNKEMIGKKKNEATQQRIKIALYDTLQYLKNVQINNKILFNNMTNEEIIESIDNIIVKTTSNNTFKILISFNNASGTKFTQCIEI